MGRRWLVRTSDELFTAPRLPMLPGHGQLSMGPMSVNDVCVMVPAWCHGFNPDMAETTALTLPKVRCFLHAERLYHKNTVFYSTSSNLYTVESVNLQAFLDRLR